MTEEVYNLVKGYDTLSNQQRKREVKNDYAKKGFDKQNEWSGDDDEWDDKMAAGNQGGDSCGQIIQCGRCCRGLRLSAVRCWR